VPSNQENARRSQAILAPSILLAFLSACGPAVVGGGIEVFTPGSASFHEREPNDSAAGPNYLTVLYAGDSIEITGHVDGGCCDPFDGFAIDAGEPLELQFELIAHDGWSDLDLRVYDPAADIFIACHENEGATEYGSLYVDANGLAGGCLAATAPADPSSGWTDYAASAAESFEIRVGRLPEADPDAPDVSRVLVRPTRRGRADGPNPRRTRAGLTSE